jgi:AraC family transcriptional regulator, activator of mtrCDE
MDALSDILSKLKLSGTLYFRTSFTAPWSIKVPSYMNVARFHYAHKGNCFVRIIPDQPAVLLQQGDLLIITRGAGHTLFCDPKSENQAVHLDRVVEESGFRGEGTFVVGETGTNHETQLVCGHFAFDRNANDFFIDSLPASIHIKNYGETAGSWMEATLRFIGNEAGQASMGSSFIALKLSEIIFTQALRTYIVQEGLGVPVLAAFAEPGIARALTAFHKSPGNPWTLEQLAKIAGMSRTAFANRFSKCMTTTPLGYITRWRMELARQQLEGSNEGLIAIAERVGYHSESAFSRIFKKHYNQAPAAYRQASRASA